MTTNHLTYDGYPIYYQPIARIHEALEQQRALNDARSAQEQEWYENRLIAEARAIVAGTSDAQPHQEHLRLLLEALDGAIGAFVPQDDF